MEKFAERKVYYQGHVDFDVSKISNLNIDLKHQVISEVMNPVKSCRNHLTHNKSKKIN